VWKPLSVFVGEGVIKTIDRGINKKRKNKTNKNESLKSHGEVRKRLNIAGRAPSNSNAFNSSKRLTPGG
jgi:hypothetical protein